MTFGCTECYGEDAEAMLEYYLQKLTTTHGIFSENHEGAALRECPKCGQQFVTIFTEVINWAAGGDDQFYDVVPVTPDEAAEIVRAGSDISMAHLNGLGKQRRHLEDIKRCGQERQILWRPGKS
jgi:hypothetical protein